MNTLQLQFRLLFLVPSTYIVVFEFRAVVFIACLIQESYGQRNLSCYTCNYSPDVPEDFGGVGVFTNKCLTPDTSQPKSEACGASDQSCHKMYLDLQFKSENTSLQILYRMCSLNAATCIHIAEQNGTFDLDSSITLTPRPRLKSMSMSSMINTKMEEIFQKFLRDVLKAKMKGRRSVDYIASGRSCGCNYRDNCNNEPGMKIGGGGGGGGGGEGGGGTLQIQILPIYFLVAFPILNISF